MLASCVAGALLAFGPSIPPGTLEVRFASADLTPRESLSLGGYTARQNAVSQPGGERLEARAFALSQGSTRLVCVSLEQLTVPASLVEAVRARIPSDVRLMMWATHTHCAPDSQMLNSRMTLAIPGIATFRPARLEWTASRLAGLVRRVLKETPHSGEWSLSSAELANNASRRELVKADPRAWRLWMGDRVVLDSYGAHATLYDETELHFRGDWPGVLMRRTGGLFAPGAIGGVSPRAPGEGAAERSRALANSLTQALANRERRSLETKLQVETAPIELGEATPHPDFAKDYGVPDALAKLAVQRFAPPAAEVECFALGNALWVGVPGEPTPQVAQRIEAFARSRGFEDCVVLSHVNGWIGYILEPEDYQKGGYEATLSFHGPGIADRVVQAASVAISRFESPRPGS